MPCGAAPCGAVGTVPAAPRRAARRACRAVGPCHAAPRRAANISHPISDRLRRTPYRAPGRDPAVHGARRRPSAQVNQAPGPPPGAIAMAPNPRDHRPFLQFTLAQTRMSVANGSPGPRTRLPPSQAPWIVLDHARISPRSAHGVGEEPRIAARIGHTFPCRRNLQEKSPLGARPLGSGCAAPRRWGSRRWGQGAELGPRRWVRGPSGRVAGCAAPRRWGSRRSGQEAAPRPSPLGAAPLGARARDSRREGPARRSRRG